MKKHLFFLFALFAILPVFSKAKVVRPEWIDNQYGVYPSEKFLSGVGHGSSENVAKNNAVSELSKFIKSSVTVLTQSTSVLRNSDGNVTSDDKIARNVKVFSNATLSGIKYSEIYYDKKAKTYWCAAYISRADAWRNFQLTLENAKANFNGFYSQAKKYDEDKEYIEAYFWYKKSFDSAENFIDQLNIAQVIDSKNAAKFAEFRQVASSVSSYASKALDNCKISISVENDFENLIYTSVSACLRQIGFSIVKNGVDYIADINVDFNEVVSGQGEETLYADFPSVLVALKFKDKVFFSFEDRIDSKILSYQQNIAHKKSLQKLGSQLSETFHKEWKLREK